MNQFKYSDFEFRKFLHPEDPHAIQIFTVDRGNLDVYKPVIFNEGISAKSGKGTDIAEVLGIAIESDVTPKDRQLAIAAELHQEGKLPDPWYVVDTGNKSWHIVYKLPSGTNFYQAKDIIEEVQELFISKGYVPDKAIGPNQPLRLPGQIHKVTEKRCVWYPNFNVEVLDPKKYLKKKKIQRTTNLDGEISFDGMSSDALKQKTIDKLKEITSKDDIRFTKEVSYAFLKNKISGTGTGTFDLLRNLCTFAFNIKVPILKIISESDLDDKRKADLIRAATKMHGATISRGTVYYVNRTYKLRVREPGSRRLSKKEITSNNNHIILEVLYVINYYSDMVCKKEDFFTLDGLYKTMEIFEGSNNNKDRYFHGTVLKSLEEFKKFFSRISEQLELEKKRKRIEEKRTYGYAGINKLIEAIRSSKVDKGVYSGNVGHLPKWVEPYLTTYFSTVEIKEWKTENLYRKRKYNGKFTVSAKATEEPEFIKKLNYEKKEIPSKRSTTSKVKKISRKGKLPTLIDCMMNNSGFAEKMEKYNKIHELKTKKDIDCVIIEVNQLYKEELIRIGRWDNRIKLNYGIGSYSSYTDFKTGKTFITDKRIYLKDRYIEDGKVFLNIENKKVIPKYSRKCADPELVKDVARYFEEALDDVWRSIQ